MSVLLSRPELPTAVYAHSDEVAAGAMLSIRNAGLRIPEDISIVGIDDHPLARLLDLTTVRQPVRHQGQLTGQLVLSLLRGNHDADAVDKSVTVPTQLAIRHTTGRAGAPS
jgi:LacI family repressor for deo operon, udp, cdd, tsx, nupC, and nupG